MTQRLSYADLPVWEVRLAVKVEGETYEHAQMLARVLADELEGFDFLIIGNPSVAVEVAVVPVEEEEETT